MSGDPFEEDAMTIALTLATPDLSELLKRRDLTVDEVAHLPEDLHYELIDGRLVLSPSALPIHQIIGGMVWHACMLNQPPEVAMSMDQSVLIDGRNERRPDVVAIRVEGASVSPVLAFDVLLAVEIISPSSVSTDREDKRKVYADSRIPRYWVVDPLAERVTLTEFALGPDGRYQQTLHTEDRVTVTSPWEITLDVPAWTERRDRIRRARRDGGAPVR